MIQFDVFIKRFGTLEAYLKGKAPELLMKHEAEIVKMNNEQLLKGKNKLSETMQKGYSPAYGKKRKKAGLQTSFVDLKFSGAYQDSRKGVKVKDGINIQSSVDYEKYLRGNFPDHVGLDKKNSDTIKELLSKEVAVLTKKYLLK